MTNATKAIYFYLVTDYIKISNITEEMLFTDDDLDATMSMIQEIDFHQQITTQGITFSCYNAGHVLGAAMFIVEIAGVRVRLVTCIDCRFCILVIIVDRMIGILWLLRFLLLSLMY